MFTKMKKGRLMKHLFLSCFLSEMNDALGWVQKRYNFGRGLLQEKTSACT